MLLNFRSLIVPTILLVAIAAGSGKTHIDSRTAAAGEGPAVLWRDPVDISTRDLYNGPGGPAHAPRPPFIFKKENFNCSSPKFEVTDQNGIRWTVKLGDEARPDTAASRLVWAAGYFATEDYYVPILHVENLPHLHRGRGFVFHGDTVKGARLKRHPPNQTKIGSWSWANDPFARTREWYGLQVLMAVINNWDLKDSNNSIYQVKGSSPEERYIITDLGASFGTMGFNNSTKGKLRDYQRSRWLDRADLF